MTGPYYAWRKIYPNGYLQLRQQQTKYKPSLTRKITFVDFYTCAVLKERKKEKENGPPLL